MSRPFLRKEYYEGDIDEMNRNTNYSRSDNHYFTVGQRKIV